MNTENKISVTESLPAPGKSNGRWHRLVIIVLIIAGVGFSVWWIKHNIFASRFTPTRLNTQEQQILDDKLNELQTAARKEHPGSRATTQEPARPLTPAPYSESGARRTIRLTEKELNALIANQPEMAQRIAIDLSEDLISLKLIVPIDPGIPLMGGKTLRLHAGLSIHYQDGTPSIAIQGVSLGGIPLPNAWLGNLKHKNLLKEFGTQNGFWQVFGAGVAEINVFRGSIQIRLKE